jgi:hypothetical protein
MFAKFFAPVAGVALIAAPAMAQSASALSVQPVAVERAAGGSDDGSQLEGGGWIAPVLAAAIVIGGILLAAGVFDKDDPVSP